MTISSLSESYFHADMPEVAVRSSAAAIKVTIMLGSVKLYEEVLYTIEGSVVLQDLGDLAEPWLASVLTDTLTVTAEDLEDDLRETGVTASVQTTLVYGWVDTDMTCSEFCNSHFLTTLNGHKTTSEGRLEYLHYIGSGTGTVTAYYSDGSTASFGTTAAAGNGKFSTINVSPSNFHTQDKQLVKYVVTVGSRRQEFRMDLNMPDCAPVLLFTNSFGCQELIYCIGKHEVKPEYNRTSAYFGRHKRNYRILEQRMFSADTGTLTTGEMNWVDELFRSKEIYVVNFVNGVPRVGREVLVVDSKSEFSNEWDAQNRAQFTYMYSQRCHNVLDATRAGRIFDNTYDNTFD